MSGMVKNKSLLSGIQLILWVSNPCKISGPYDNPFLGGNKSGKDNKMPFLVGTIQHTRAVHTIRLDHK